MNRTLEAARTGKLIGSSLEAKVYLHAFNEGLAVRLNDMCETKNDADTLHRIFITSQVCLEITQIFASSLCNVISLMHLDIYFVLP